MRMEMPDRIEDLLYAPSHYIVPMHITGQAGGYLSQRAIPQRFGLLHKTLQAAILNSIPP